MPYTYFEFTDVGGRKNNQDYFAHQLAEDWACFVVADGLGGHPKGEVASRYFCDALLTQVSDDAKLIPLDPINTIENVVKKAHKAMVDKIIQTFGFIDCHTTFAFLWMDDKTLITAHVGDSRVYRIDSSNVLWRTPDHTMVQQLFEAGEITEEDFSTHPLQNRLMRTVNLFDAPVPDIFVHSPLEKEEIMVLCTDGFWTYLKREDWVSLAKAEDRSQKIQEWIHKIVAKHPLDADNITVQLIYTLPR